MAYSDLDDVDYLVEDNVMDEFAYPTPDCITRKFQEFISGNSSSLRVSVLQLHDMRLGFDV